MDDELRALERAARESPEARFRLHAALDRRVFAAGVPLTPALDAEVSGFASRIAALLGSFDELEEADLARGVAAPPLGAEDVRWAWLERPDTLVLIVREGGTVTVDGEHDRTFFAPFAADDDGSNVGDRMLLLEPSSPAAAFVAWARQPGARFLRVREEVALRWALRVTERPDVGWSGQNTR